MPTALVERFGHAAVRPIDDHPQHRADRFAPELDVEDLEPVTPGDALGRARARPQLFSRGVNTPLKKKKWAQAHSGNLTRSCHP